MPPDEMPENLPGHIIEGDELLSLLPHRGRMLLLSKISAYDIEEGTICGEALITRDNLFFDPAINAVPAWAAYEFMAQAIAALSGLRKHGKNGGIKAGFILSISSMQIEISSFLIGAVPEIRVKEISSLDQVHNFEGQVFLEGRKVLEGRLTVMDADDEQIKSMSKGK